MVAKKLTEGVRTWIEIDTKALKNNYDIFRSLIPKSCKLLSVVKSNAYGHGLVDFSMAVSDLGTDWLGVDSITEGMKLRDKGIKKPILVLGYTLPEMMIRARDNDISVAVSHFEGLKSLEGLTFLDSDSAKKINIHIKVDSGMHRQGFVFEDSQKVITFLKKHSDTISVQGLFTHFASAKNPAFPQNTLLQIEEFKKWVTAFKDAGFSPIVHASATSGTILFSDSHFDMVRVGIGMYGLWPSLETKNFAKRNINLLPVLSWKTIIGEVKKLSKGESIGYDFTEKLKHDSKIAICPIGYWHGYPRALSCIGEVLVGGVRAKVLGRVSMDMIVIDVTDVKNVKVGDQVTIIGQDGKDCISAEEVALSADSSYYEILTRINPLIRKIYV